MRYVTIPAPFALALPGFRPLFGLPDFICRELVSLPCWRVDAASCEAACVLIDKFACAVDGDVVELTDALHEMLAKAFRSLDALNPDIAAFVLHLWRSVLSAASSPPGAPAPAVSPK